MIPLKLKNFVCATSAPSSSTNNEDRNEECNFTEASSIKGEKTSSFYMNVTNCKERIANAHDNSEDIVICGEVKQCSLNNDTRELPNIRCHLINKAMKFAQYDDLQSLEGMIKKGVSVNATDDYGWSLLMVASYAGSKNVVKYLLNKNARKWRRDSKGNTALYLASIANHTDVVNMLIKCKEKPLKHLSLAVEYGNSESSSSDADFCGICNINYSCSKREHRTSIVHLFNKGSKDIRPLYGIPRSNVGFQMLLQQGWDDNKGLGPQGSGRRYPIKAKLKQDRLGIGEKSTSIGGVTNEGNKKGKILNHSTRKITKHLRNYEKLKERNIRKMLNEPDI